MLMRVLAIGTQRLQLEVTKYPTEYAMNFFNLEESRLTQPLILKAQKSTEIYSRIIVVTLHRQKLDVCGYSMRSNQLSALAREIRMTRVVHMAVEKGRLLLRSEQVQQRTDANLMSSRR